MNRTLLIGVTLATVLVASSSALAQKKPLDHSVYDSWQATSAANVTDDGKTAVWLVSPQEGDGTLYIRNVESGREISIERGGAPTLSKDGRWAVFTVKAPYAATRQAKIEKKKADQMPKDSLAYVDLSTFEVHRLGEATKLKTALEDGSLIGFETGAKDSVVTEILNLATGVRDTLRHVGSYVFDKTGSRIAAVLKKDKKDSLSVDAVILYHPASGVADTLSRDKKFYSGLKFNDGGDKLAFIASTDTVKTGNKHCSVFLWEDATKKTAAKVSEILPQGYSGNLPEGWGVNENAGLRFSRLSDRLFVGFGEMLPPNDTTIVDFETAQLDIWNWDIPITPPGQKARKESIEKATREGVINLAADRGKLIPLTTNAFESLSLADGGEARKALVVDTAPYMLQSTWDSNDLCDVYMVDLDNGVRSTLFTALNGRPSLSPTGKYLLWYSSDDLDIHTYDIEKGFETNLTKGLDGLFYNDEDDHPSPKPQIARPVWYDGDSALLLTDKYDIWRVRPDGSKAVCLTEGKGRAANIQYRYVTLERSLISPALREVGVSKTINDKDVLYMTAFDRNEQENGYATVKAAKAGLLTSFTAPALYSSVVKSAGADVFVVRKGDFRHPYDVWIGSSINSGLSQCTHINPQQDEYRWGDVQLVHWKGYDGTPLDGVLYTPDGVKPGEKLPMMIYFYEKNAHTRYNYYSPAPSRSVICIPFYVSRGYVVFVPDIKYVDGHPGESAYNCICSGAEAMCRQFSYIDKDKMAIQGQSWGGYQTAYLVTRTNMFAAAGAGAPVGNMTSAYGGIRWESGLVRAMQYEKGQSRIGKSMWEEGGLDLYIENSPIFHTEDVTTPVLIMHNDNDGMVPWYQGIEFFMALRRFEHPAWLLEYNNEAHNLAERRNCKDLTIRLQQFFDHYLKGEPMPAWMKTGVPLTRKGQYFGFENAE